MAQTLTNMMPKLGLSKKVLLLGAGFVTKPTLQLLSESGVGVTVGCRTLASAEKLCNGTANTYPISLDVSNTQDLDEAVSKVNLVISLIPYTFHVEVVKSAIRNKKDVVTTSYVSPAMQDLHKEAQEAGITVLNEIGLDPGIDHLYAVKTIDEVHREGGKITSFLSYCGGLPAPESSDNPLGYKFSWSSRGMLLALRNTAKFWLDGEETEIPGEELMHSAAPYHIFPGFNLVAYANRDSTPYKERYSIPEATTVIRGTLRYGGFPEFVGVLTEIGLLSPEPHSFLSSKNAEPPSWSSVTASILGARSTTNTSDLTKMIEAKRNFPKEPYKKTLVLNGLKWLGILSETTKATPRDTPLDTLCALLEEKCQYEEDERDMVLLQHKFGIQWQDGRDEVRTSTLVEYGEKQAADGSSTSAMAKMVGIPCGVAVRMVLEGKIEEKGVLAPLEPKLAGALRDEIEKFGIKMIEKTVVS